MNPSKQIIKKQEPLPESVDYKTWLTRLEGLVRLLEHRSRVFYAFNQWAIYQSAYFDKIGQSQLSSGDGLLKEAFELTQPVIASETDKRKYEVATTAVRELVPKLRDAIKALKVTGCRIEPKDGTAVYRFDTLQHSLQTTESEIRKALIVTDKRYMRSPDILSHCILFLISLDDCGVSEADAYALTSLLMRAHGFTNELVVFDKGLIYTGTIRKRVRAARKEFRKTELAQKWHLESYRKMVLERQSDLVNKLKRGLGLE
jgi:hypothetical protein